MATEPEGLLPVDKPAGPSSHDMVAAARHVLGTRRIGHTGTLDPFASGLLLLLVGPATRLAEYFDGLPKTYHARLRIGVGTDTDDPTGTVIARGDPEGIDPEAVRAALRSQIGARTQRPPAFSAKKVGGERAYRAARAGLPVELAPVPVHIHDIEVGAMDGADVEFTVTCGAGTYIRSIARDAGEMLGVPAHLTALRRVAIGPWTADAALPLDRLTAESARAALVAPAEAVGHLRRMVLDTEQAEAIAHGRRPRVGMESTEGPVAMIAGDRLLAVGIIADGQLVPRKVFHA